jgi:hypothetical protein
MSKLPGAQRVKRLGATSKPIGKPANRPRKRKAYRTTAVMRPRYRLVVWIETRPKSEWSRQVRFQQGGTTTETIAPRRVRIQWIE